MNVFTNILWSYKNTWQVLRSPFEVLTLYRGSGRWGGEACQRRSGVRTIDVHTSSHPHIYILILDL